MKNKLSYILFTILGLSLITPNVFAANPYGITYTGGETLGDSGTVNINPELVNDLTPLIKMDQHAQIKFKTPTKWQSAYIRSGGACRPISYFLVEQANFVDANNEFSYEISRGQYTAEIQIEKVLIEDVPDLASDNAVTIVLDQENGFIGAGWRVYEEPTCNTTTNGIRRITIEEGGRAFIQMKIKLYHGEQRTVFSSNQLYFGITDIDSAQSFKILNDRDRLKPSNMFARSVGSLQSSDPNSPRNMYEASENYIYSQAISPILDANNCNVFVKISTETQEEGLGVVYGFATFAGSGVEYYAKQYTVTYDSDENGSITGITSENIISGLNPSGSTSTPKEGYELDYWIADKDVTLKNGTTIKAGNKITMDQIKEVVVNQDLKFTAIHKDEIKVPNTGAFTKDTNATAIILPVFGIIIGALIVGLLPRITRKKVKF